ncbi:MAG: amino acid racemase [Bacillota bacterium]|nr:amino acid racemase [Bacillota bacterium]
MPRKIIGILGGMGPEATADLFLKIIKSTPAKKDQEHLRILIDNNPQIPDRTAAILHGGKDPTPALVETGKNLERAGADFLIIPCNTAHYFHGKIQDAVTIPVLHMMSATADEMKARGIKRAGLLASDGTVQSGLYHQALAQRGIEVVVPNKETQQKVMDAIYGVKSGEFVASARDVKQAAEELIEAGATGVIAGCTEIPLILADGDVSMPVIDATAALARAAVQEALGQA